MNCKENFVWGTATASYQIEGAYSEDGKGLNIWDVFTHQKGRVKDNSTGDIACDHYHLYKEDVKLIKNLGTKAYRFSLSWSRIIPDGIGKINQKGIDFYNNLIDELIKNGITPYVTLFHWDYPEALQLRGGWLNPESPEWFENYAKVVADNFGDRVKNFITINEPQCIFGLGHNTMLHAPALTLSLKEQLIGVHNLLLAHGRAVIALRKINDVKIGYAPCGGVPLPLDNIEKAIKEAKKIYFSMQKNSPLGSVVLYSDPVCLGDYPKEYYDYYKDILPDIKKEDLKIISSPIDFYCQNIYTGFYGNMDSYGNISYIQQPQGSPFTAMGWSITPECLYWGSKFLTERYNLPLYITENGVSYSDVISKDGKIKDENRIEYLRKYITSLLKAENEGVQIKGYFVWSLMDNFEWNEGYAQRFGLVYVDYKTLKRIPKESYYWYKSVVESNGKVL